ncbi:MAG: response regulator [Gallionella sp.]|nr:response regulator [Gallionella sp.]
MSTPNSAVATILIATDIVDDAAIVKDILGEEFKRVFVSSDPARAVADFEQHHPDVLILAFNQLEKSERYYLGLYRLCKSLHQHPHRTVILCNKDEVKRVYELCMKDFFDDYILFWPMTYDPCRLLMSVHYALRDLASLKSGGPSAAEFAAQARRLAELENTLSRQMAQGGQHVEAASWAMKQAEQKIDASLDKFSQRIINGEMPESVEIKNADNLKKEISHLKQDEIQQHFHTAAESSQPLKQWAHQLKQECEPLLKSARTMNAMAERIRPTVLVVDDDEFQRKLIGKLLEAENYQLVFATGGADALNILRKTRPDIILMDVMMPDLDGMETTRRLKAIPHFAKTPVIMVTGNSEGNVVVDSLKAGASDFVVKPFDRATLLAKIARVISAAAAA